VPGPEPGGIPAPPHGKGRGRPRERRGLPMVAGGASGTPLGEDLLAVDIGNTNTVLGLWHGDQLLRHWRLTSRREARADEIVLSVRGLLDSGTPRAPVPPMRVIIASVVPSLRFPMRQAFRQIVDREPLFVEPGVKTGMPILYDVPQEVGADRIVN